MKKCPGTKAGRSAPQAGGFASVRANLLFLVIGVLIAMASQFLWATYRARANSSKSVSGSAGLVGPWGRLEVRRLLLERPAEMLPRLDPKPAPVRWFFAGRNPEQTIGFLSACGLTDAQRAALTSPTALAPQPDGCFVIPAMEVVMTLSPTARGKIYAELEKHPQNLLQQNPYCIRYEDAAIWFSRVGLPKNKVEALMKLTYRRGNALCFCDVDAAKQFLLPAEFQALNRALHSTSMLVVSLRLKPEDSVDALAAYWGRGGRTSTVKALLESVARAPNATEINISALLPPLPRAWLCTYPDEHEPAIESADCYYSSLNFFRKTPESRYLDPQFRDETFRRNYQVVPKANRLGDILVFVDGRGITQHACVYVADDIVFTKNGAQPTHPWVLMCLNDVSAIYAREPGGSLVVFRILTL